MKKLAIILAVVLVVSIPIQADATTWDLPTTPNLTYTGINATCNATVYATSTSDHIEVNMKLMWGDTCVASWTAHGDGYLTITKTVPVTYGRTYTLVVNTWINGIQQTTQSVTKTC